MTRQQTNSSFVTINSSIVAVNSSFVAINSSIVTVKAADDKTTNISKSTDRSETIAQQKITRHVHPAKAHTTHTHRTEEEKCDTQARLGRYAYQASVNDIDAIVDGDGCLCNVRS